MKYISRAALAGFLAGVVSMQVLASNEVEGRIEAVDSIDRTFVVQGITFHVTESTDYDDDLSRFEDLRPGQKVEVEFDYRDGRHIAKEIELDD